ncbi:MAG TPA: sodium-dependent transporter [Gammaproteobacteria bacterium]|nr:sodium-dependent transporter [Gammaproteobacteria bacterium]
MTIKPRQLFSSRTATVLSLIGVAVGLGNVWRFPYMMGRYGGSAFLFVYLAFTALFAIPALTGEIALGRATRKGPVGALSDAFGARAGLPIGLLLLVTILVADSYYVVVIANVAYSFWVGVTHGFSPTAQSDLQAGLADGTLQYVIAIGILIISLYVIYSGLKKGIERISTIFVPFFWLSTVALIVGALSLPGAFAKVEAFLRPDFSAMRPVDFFAAMGQSIYSLGLGGTFMVVYGGYIARDTSIAKTAIGTAAGNAGASLLSALFIVPTALVFGMNMTQGPRLIFETLPHLFHRLPFGGVLGAAFLGGLIMVAFLSNAAALEVLYAGAEDLPGKQVSGGRRLAVIGVILAVLIAPSAFHPSLIAYLDLIFGSGMQALGCAFAVIGLAWGLGRSDTLRELFGAGAGRWQGAYYQWLRWAVPGVLLLALAGYVYQSIATA